MRKTTKLLTTIFIGVSLASAELFPGVPMQGLALAQEQTTTVQAKTIARLGLSSRIIRIYWPRACRRSLSVTCIAPWCQPAGLCCLDRITPLGWLSCSEMCKC